MKLRSFHSMILIFCLGMVNQILFVHAATALEALPRKTESNPSTQLSPSQTPAPQGDEYIIGAGDGLDLKLYDALDFSGPFEVLSDGTATLPLIGSVRLTGLTLSQASFWLTTLFRQQMKRPDLLLRVVRPRPIRVAVVGEVQRPGVYSLTTSEVSQVVSEGGPGVIISGLPTVVDVIQKAGGITLNADLRVVILQRRLPGESPSFKRTRLDLLALVQAGDQLQNPFLFDGDTLRIEKADQPVEESIELAAVNLSPQEITVNVVGEVKKPGRIQLGANTPLMQAVLAAGGVESWRASQSRIELIRINRNGTATREVFGLDLSQGASNAKNPPLRNGDTVIVNRSGFAVASDALGAVTQPLTGLVSIGALFRILNN
ncbi:MAG: sugar transporter [Cyanobium sp.]|nr:MAG: sugar transporter [Cyanobium sp.]